MNVYRRNPKLDIHQWVADMAGITRAHAKTLNLGLSYGMASARTAHSLGLPTVWAAIVKGSYVRGEIPKFIEGEPTLTYAEMVNAVARDSPYDWKEIAGEEAKAIRQRWRYYAPFLNGLFDATEWRAREHGVIKTFLQRRCRFPVNKKEDSRKGAYLNSHKAMNRLCQSSAADQTKTAMRDLWRDGIVPRLTVHDELVFSLPFGHPVAHIQERMQQAIKLRVPSIADVKRGLNWGKMKKE